MIKILKIYFFQPINHVKKVMDMKKTEEEEEEKKKRRSRRRLNQKINNKVKKQT